MQPMPYGAEATLPGHALIIEPCFRLKNYKTQTRRRIKPLYADWSVQNPIRGRRRVSRPEHPSVMAPVWTKTSANLTVLSVFFLLLLCLPPGGGQKKKEVTLQPCQQFSNHLTVVLNERGAQVESADAR